MIWSYYSVEEDFNSNIINLKMRTSEENGDIFHVYLEEFLSFPGSTHTNIGTHAHTWEIYPNVVKISMYTDFIY